MDTALLDWLRPNLLRLATIARWGSVMIIGAMVMSAAFLHLVRDPMERQTTADLVGAMAPWLVSFLVVGTFAKFGAALAETALNERRGR